MVVALQDACARVGIKTTHAVTSRNDVKVDDLLKYVIFLEDERKRFFRPKWTMRMVSLPDDVLKALSSDVRQLL